MHQGGKRNVNLFTWTETNSTFSSIQRNPNMRVCEFCQKWILSSFQQYIYICRLEDLGFSVCKGSHCLISIQLFPHCFWEIMLLIDQAQISFGVYKCDSGSAVIIWPFKNISLISSTANLHVVAIKTGVPRITAWPSKNWKFWLIPHVSFDSQLYWLLGK